MIKETSSFKQGGEELISAEKQEFKILKQEKYDFIDNRLFVNSDSVLTTSQSAVSSWSIKDLHLISTLRC
jgi:hypothetical protein